MPHEIRAVRAVFDDETITVYQAYSAAIALPALDAQRFVPPFKRDRMTWIKPSFLWMMYRSGWATKEGQEHVLAVRLRRAGFDAALAGACLSHYSPGVHANRAEWSRLLRTSPVRVQWDPERSLQLQPLGHRSLQLGLSGDAVHRYVDEWTVDIRDVTPLAHAIHGLVTARALDEAQALLPDERPYPADRSR
ncbi:DUF4291 domain-containing protein [Dactylosporangium sp. NPDC049525]|uniref:DUF4291 domain-containing protein n=1 Tax=Dactylosporangium sp. NPDC049525 TaxID=3154730 RepID=UPI003433BAD9